MGRVVRKLWRPPTRGSRATPAAPGALFESVRCSTHSISWEPLRNADPSPDPLRWLPICILSGSQGSVCASESEKGAQLCFSVREPLALTRACTHSRVSSKV